MGVAVPLTASIVLATRGRPDAVAVALPALAAAAAAVPGTEVLVVEQGGTGAALLASELGLAHLADPGAGVSRARNRGIAATSGDVVLFTDDDCVVPITWVATHVAALEADPQLAGSCGEVTGLPRHEDDGADPTREPLRHGRDARPWDVGHASNLAVRRAVLVAVGGFDERLGPGARGVQAGEDADLLARLLAGGHVLASGVGEPVRHADWRSEVEEAATLLAYERGAGAWIGAAIRARRPGAGGHLRARWWLLRPRLALVRRERGLVAAARLAGALAGGVVRGLALPPWPTARIR